jgi:rhomboid family GlyGly-CTERM serine protease
MGVPGVFQLTTRRMALSSGHGNPFRGRGSCSRGVILARMPARLSLPARSRFDPVHGLWLGIAGLSLLLQWFGMEQAWQFDRQLIDHGHYWLLLSCHLVHTGWSHWAMNMAGLALVAFFFSPYATVWQWIAVFLVSALVASTGSYLFDPQLQVAVGLSAVLHGLFVFGALREIRVYPQSGYVLLALLCAKLTWEYLHGALPGSERLAGGHVATAAHLYGAIGGVLVALCLYLLCLYRAKTSIH